MRLKKQKKKTTLERYGNENYRNIEQAKETNIAKYGVEYPNAYGTDKFKKMMIERYNVEYASQSEEIRKKQELTMLKRYGYSHSMQVPEFHKQAMINRSKHFQLKEINENLHYQSKPELEFINWCQSNNVEAWDGPSIPYILKEKKHIYHVDFETDKWIVEIKSKHIWYYNDITSGKLDAKNKAATEYANNVGKKFKFLLDVQNYDIVDDLAKENG